MTPKITQVAPKCLKKTPHGAQILSSWNRLAPRIAFGALLASFLMILNGFQTHFSSILDPLFMHFVMFWYRILQIPERRATATNNQELPRTFRNLAIEIALLQFALLQNASSCNKRMHQNAELQNGGRRCSRRMAHSDPLRARGRPRRV